MGVSADDYVIVCVGMIRPDKGQDHLIGALGLMKQQGLTPPIGHRRQRHRRGAGL